MNQNECVVTTILGLFFLSNVNIAEYSREYNGYKYIFKEAAVKSSFYKAEEF